MPYIINTSFDEKYSLKAAPIADDPLYVYRKEANHRTKDGVPIPGHVVPKGFSAKSRQKAAPDYFHVQGEVMVSEKFKNLLESFEPDVHQFFPVNGYHPDTGEPRTLECYLFNCCNLVEKSFVEPQQGVDCEDLQQTSDGRILRVRRNLSSECTSKYWSYKFQRFEGGYFLRPEIVGNLHFWRERHFGSNLFISDEFFFALREHGVHAALESTRRFFPLLGKDYGEGG